jgi:hypothetical protein
MVKKMITGSRDELPRFEEYKFQILGCGFYGAIPWSSTSKSREEKRNCERWDYQLYCSGSGAVCASWVVNSGNPLNDLDHLALCGCFY